MGLEKNVAGQKVRVFAFDETDNTPVTGDAAQITGKIDLDWAGPGAITDPNPTETEDGYYLFDLTQGETNAKVLDIYPESSTSNVRVIGVPGTIYTDPPNLSNLGVESDGDLTKVNLCANTTLVDTITAYTGNTPQTGDAYAIVNNGAYGNAMLVRSTTPANPLDVSAGGTAGIDWANIDNVSSSVNFSNTTIALVDTTTTNSDMVAEAPTAAAVVNEWETRSQADPTGFHVNVIEIGGTAQTANDNGADINAILLDTDNLQTNQGNWLTATGFATLGALASHDSALTAHDGNLSTVSGQILTLNDLSAAEANAACDTALSDIYLNYIFATSYDPASKPGVATALFNELVGDDGGVSQFTANALELGPSGTGATPAEVETACDASLASIFLHQLFAANYDPDSKPGVATALLNELIESIAGVSRYTASALSQASGTGASVSDIVDGVFNALYAAYTNSGSFGEWAALVLAKVNQIGTATVTYTSPVADDGAFDIIGGDDYLAADNRAIELTVEDYSGPDLTSATGEFRIMNAFEFDTTTDTDGDLVVSATVSGGSGTTITMTADLTSAQTTAMQQSPPRLPQNYDYRFVAETAGGSVVTLSTGTVTVQKGIEEEA
jgi:hypothetical protein